MPRGWGAATGGSSGIQKGPNNYFKPGTWNARCATCNRMCKADEMLKLSVYDGNVWVCRRRSCYEVPNPQQFVRGIPDHPNVPWVQNPPDLFIGSDPNSGMQTKTGLFLLGGRLLGGQLLG